MNPSVGRIVHYVLPSGPSMGEHRAAIITRIWGSGEHASSVQLTVFTDSNAEGTYNDQIPNPLWATSVTEDPTGVRHGSWHWPERVD